MSAIQFKELTGGFDVSGRYVDLGTYFGCGDDGELVDVEDAVLRLSIMERKGERFLFAYLPAAVFVEFFYTCILIYFYDSNDLTRCLT